jgi:hypothetical protein
MEPPELCLRFNLTINCISFSPQLTVDLGAGGARVGVIRRAEHCHEDAGIEGNAASGSRVATIGKTTIPSSKEPNGTLLVDQLLPGKTLGYWPPAGLAPFLSLIFPYP